MTQQGSNIRLTISSSSAFELRPFYTNPRLEHVSAQGWRPFFIIEEL